MRDAPSTSERVSMVTPSNVANNPRVSSGASGKDAPVLDIADRLIAFQRKNAT